MYKLKEQCINSTQRLNEFKYSNILIFTQVSQFIQVAQLIRYLHPIGGLILKFWCTYII